MVGTQPLSRRSVIKSSAAPLVGCLLSPSVLKARQATPAARDPLVAGMVPSTVITSDSYKAARGFEVVLNTQVQAEADVQNRFDLAVLEMFNVMKTNEPLLANGEFTSFIAGGNIPEGGDLEEFGQVVQNTNEVFPITTMFYPEGATSNEEGQWGTFDAKNGLELNFVEEEGLFVVSMNGDTGGQIFGMTPRLTEEGGLQIDVYSQFELPPPGYPNAENASDIAETWLASNMMQIMLISYGKNDIYIDHAQEQSDMFFNAPYTMNETIASQMSNLPVGSNNYFNNGISNRSCLLDFKPLGQ